MPADAIEISPADTGFMLLCAALVLFMTPGLAFFYGGMVRQKNVLSMLMQNFFTITIVTFTWVLIGFSIAFGPGGNAIVGKITYLLGKGVGQAISQPWAEMWGESVPKIPELAYLAYQLMFAIITPALMTGAFAERLKFKAFIAIIALWSILVYAPLAHWVWSPEGWLFKLGALDFAGGTVVHINAGVGALVLALILGKRKGWPDSPDLRPHSLPLTLLGTGILWFGWFGFNAGSALGASGLAAQAFINTQIGAAMGALGWVVAEWIKDKHPTTLGAASGAVAGLVAITPAAGFVNEVGSIVIGVLAGAICYLAVSIKYKAGYDDSLDVVGVHMVGGIVGALLTGVLALDTINPLGKGLLQGNPKQLGIQAIGVIATLLYSGILTAIIAAVVKAIFGLRVEEETEVAGLDVREHGEQAYVLE
jgi:Amt family ammonium transporter